MHLNQEFRYVIEAKGGHLLNILADRAWFWSEDCGFFWVSEADIQRAMGGMMWPPTEETPLVQDIACVIHQLPSFGRPNEWAAMCHGHHVADYLRKWCLEDEADEDHPQDEVDWTRKVLSQIWPDLAGGAR